MDETKKTICLNNKVMNMTWVQDWCIAGCQEKMFSIRLNFRFIMADAEGSISKNEQKRQLKVLLLSP